MLQIGAEELGHSLLEMGSGFRIEGSKVEGLGLKIFFLRDLGLNGLGLGV